MTMSSSRCAWASSGPREIPAVAAQGVGHGAFPDRWPHFIPANKLLKSADETRKVILTEKESTILKYLYRAHPNRVPKEELLAEVWGFQNGLSTHTVETHIYRLRQKVKRLTTNNVIVTTTQGYSWDQSTDRAAAGDDDRNVGKSGWGGRIRTYDTRYQKPMPYHLATPQAQSWRNVAANIWPIKPDHTPKWQLMPIRQMTTSCRRKARSGLPRPNARSS